MKKVIMYKSNDGKLFESESEAIAHEKSESINTKIRNIVRGFYYRDMGEDSLCDALIENKGELLNILTK